LFSFIHSSFHDFDVTIFFKKGNYYLKQNKKHKNAAAASAAAYYHFSAYQSVYPYLFL